MQSELYTLSRNKLILKCKELKIKRYSSKNKQEIIDMISNHNVDTLIPSLKNITINDTNNVDTLIPSLKNITINDTNTTYKFIDLFCGIGGFHQALTQLNCECVYACDINKHCRDIYELNYNIVPEGNIQNINISQIPQFDILCAGFPCQPFSKAGYQKGFNDNRGNLFYIICDIIKYHKPQYILLENVRNLSTHDNGNTWTTIYNLLNTLGYNTYVKPVILNVLHFNIPQNRERVVIMCKLKTMGDLPLLPTIIKSPKTKLTRFIDSFIISDINNTKYNLSGKLKVVEGIWDEFILLLISHNISMPKFPIWTDWWDNNLESNPSFYNKYKSWIDKNRLFYTTNKHILSDWLDKSRKLDDWKGAVRKFEWQAGDLLPSDSMNSILWSSRGSGIRVKRLDYIPTLVAMSMIPIYGPLGRKMTPRELLRLQSFPDSFKYNEKHIFKQVGNAVNVIMIRQCAQFLIFNQSLF
jgi:DNA (cytosine-5)-methyltransferase 1